MLKLCTGNLFSLGDFEFSLWYFVNHVIREYRQGRASENLQPQVTQVWSKYDLKPTDVTCCTCWYLKYSSTMLYVLVSEV